MSNTVCLAGPPFSITGETNFFGYYVSFAFSFNNTEDQSTVLAYQWYINAVLVIDNNQPDFTGNLPTGSYTISGRILTAGGWSGIKSLAFQTGLAAGILVVDIYGDPTLNVIGYIENNEDVYTGHNILPPDEPASYALTLASDLLINQPAKWRFQFNLAALTNDLPAPVINFYIMGRGSTAGPLTGSYSAYNIDAEMTMAGGPGSYVPGVSGGTQLLNVPFNSHVVAGANGSYGQTDLTNILTIAVDFDHYTLTATTY